MVANVLFLLALGFGGALVPIGDLPGPVADVVRFSPVGALADTFAAALGNGTAIAAPFGILLFWAVAGRRLRRPDVPLGLTARTVRPTRTPYPVKLDHHGRAVNRGDRGPARARGTREARRS